MSEEEKQKQRRLDAYRRIFTSCSKQVDLLALPVEEKVARLQQCVRETLAYPVPLPVIRAPAEEVSAQELARAKAYAAELAQEAAKALSQESRELFIADMLNALPLRLRNAVYQLLHPTSIPEPSSTPPQSSPALRESLRGAIAPELQKIETPQEMCEHAARQATTPEERAALREFCERAFPLASNPISVQKSDTSSLFPEKSVVVDTSFLVNYYFGGELEFLCAVFKEVIITPVVWRECLNLQVQSRHYQNSSLSEQLKTIPCRSYVEELTPDEKFLTEYFRKKFLEIIGEVESDRAVHKGEMEALVIFLTRKDEKGQDYDALISDNHAPFILRKLAFSLLKEQGMQKYSLIKDKLGGIKIAQGLYPLKEGIERGIINTVPSLDKKLNKFCIEREDKRINFIYSKKHRLKLKLAAEKFWEKISK